MNHIFIFGRCLNLLNELDKLRQLSDDDLIDRLASIISYTSYLTYYKQVLISEDRVKQYLRTLLEEDSHIRWDDYE